MTILAIDTSAASISVAICKDNKIISACELNVKVTHSNTLMPIINFCLKSANLTISDINALACTYGPGSFTGIRIGIATIKGLSLPGDIPCVPVSTLEAIAYPFKDSNKIICSVMDARCNQFYNALFKSECSNLIRLTLDNALKCNEIIDILKSEYMNEQIIIAGDGTDLFANNCTKITNISPANNSVKYQNAKSVALIAENKFINGEFLSAEELLPIYLRPSQAEREHEERINKL